VSELAEPLSMSLSAVVQHVAVLQESRPDGSVAWIGSATTSRTNEEE
jgi:hypothetical protein